METPTDHDEMDAKLGRNRERILLAMFRHGDLKSREIRDQVGLSRGSKDYQLDVLQEWGVVEIVDYDESSGGHPERVFGLTDEGREFTDEYLTDAGERPDGYEMRVQRLEDEVDDLQTENERLEDEIKELRTQKVDESTIEELIDRLHGTYWDSIIAAIEQRTE